MASLSTRDPEYVDFEEGMNTLRYRHAIVYSGQKLMHQVMVTLCEDPRKLKETIKEALVSKTKFKNVFTKKEVEELDTLPHRKWNLSLLFKVIQKTCGLSPEGAHCWTHPVNGEEPLEYMLTKLKNWRNNLAHNIYQVIPSDQLPMRLDELEAIADKVISALKETLKHRSRSIPAAELKKTTRNIKDVVKEVKKMDVIIIKHGDTDSGSDMDDAHGSTAAVMPGQTPRVASLEELYNDLLADFWNLAGYNDLD